MIESPKEPPRGDFSAEFDETQQTQQQTVSPAVIEEPIDVNIQGDTSKVFYDYNPDEANEIVVLETLTEESPKSEDIPALPDIPVPQSSFDFPPEITAGTEQLITQTTTILSEGDPLRPELTPDKSPPLPPIPTTGKTATLPKITPTQESISKTVVTTTTTTSTSTSLASSPAVSASSSTTSPASSPHTSNEEDDDEGDEHNIAIGDYKKDQGDHKDDQVENTKQR